MALSKFMQNLSDEERLEMENEVRAELGLDKKNSLKEIEVENKKTIESIVKWANANNPKQSSNK